MSSIGLTEEFSEYFNDFITREYPLFQFNLSNNDLKNNFVENIKPYLINMKIQFLELEKSKLDDVGLYFLLNGLIHNSSLFDLNLRQNEFSLEIIPFLRSFLIKNKVLKILRFKFYFVDCYSNSNNSEINFKLLELNKERKDKNYSAYSKSKYIRKPYIVSRNSLDHKNKIIDYYFYIICRSNKK
jgi:hypothetical protein